MSREIINVGAVPNDGTGDPIRTAYIKCNNNFGELYSRAQSSPPVTLVGTIGDQAGMYAYDQNSFYYCYADYDASSEIWGVVADFQPTQIDNGNSSVKVASSGNVSISVRGVANVGVFTSSGLITNYLDIGNVGVSGNVVAGSLYTGSILSGNILPTANLIYNLGSDTARWNDLYLSGNTIYLNSATITSNASAITFTNQAGGEFVFSGSNSNNTSISVGQLTVAGNAALGNLDVGSINTTDPIVSAGNITTNGFVFGDGRYLTNITAVSNVAVSQIANSTSIAGFNSPGSSFQVQVASVANVAVITASGLYLEGLISATGNIDSANIAVTGRLTTTGNVIASGNVNGNYILGNGAFLSGVITSVANINLGSSNITVTSPGGNIVAGVNGVANVATFTSTGFSVTGNIAGGNISSPGQLSATGNVSGGNVIATANVSGDNVIATANVSGGNVIATANVSGGNLVTSAVTIAGTGAITGVTTFNSSGNANVGNLGAVTVVATNLSGALTTASQPNITSVGNLTLLTVTGNINSGIINSSSQFVTGNIDVTGNINVLGNVNYNAVNDLVVGDPLIYIGANNSANVYDLGMVVSWTDSKFQYGGLVRDATDGVWKLFGNVVQEPTTTVNFTDAIYQPLQAGVVTTTGILNANGNGVGNIGSSSGYFNTVFAKATSAEYADVAEYYESDADYPAGTVLKFGKDVEVTIADADLDPLIVGIVSDRPAFIMNSKLTGSNVIAVALLGRVPCLVQGTIRRGQMMVSAGNGRARAETNPVMGTVIGKALENFDGDFGQIEILVGRL